MHTDWTLKDLLFAHLKPPEPNAAVNRPRATQGRINELRYQTQSSSLRETRKYPPHVVRWLPDPRIVAKHELMNHNEV